ncbi:MucR family transcriptional regulator [Pseudooceanicola nanhaiensis]|uniref:MucR family transcriptional regulator n=1 Tax=Pseudooceanicola nanhaiensis TaxID=375761 RepID=UPI001CD25B12|nr:MucR family transcriptional regulator [Pseudooceanicola nanhaiensis]MCA0922608.1 MucR family transcriptional regulator [Pseudooceanicola nanhaiensis]
MIAQIAAAYASRPDVSADDIIALVGRLTQALDPEAEVAALMNETTFTASAPSAAPALPVEQAITQDKVFCLCCGKGFKMLKRHLGSEHGLTEAEYRAMFNLAEDFPLVAPSYSKRKADYAKQAGFGKYSRQTPDKGSASRQKAD